MKACKIKKMGSLETKHLDYIEKLPRRVQLMNITLCYNLWRGKYLNPPFEVTQIRLPVGEYVAPRVNRVCPKRAAYHSQNLTVLNS